MILLTAYGWPGCVPVFIVLTCNIVTGIMLGFVTLVVGRVFAREWQKLNIGTVIITAALVAFYAGGWAI